MLSSHAGGLSESRESNQDLFVLTMHVFIILQLYLQFSFHRTELLGIVSVLETKSLTDSVRGILPLAVV